MRVRLLSRPILAVHLAVVTLTLVLTRPAAGTTLLEMDIDSVAAGAAFIFEGTVIDLQAQQDPAGTIRTYITFEVSEVLKGDPGLTTVELRFLGGSVNGRITDVAGSRLPAAGETGIYFVESLTQDLVNPLIGWSQGHYLIQTDTTGQRRVTTVGAAPVTGVQPVRQVPGLLRRPPTLLFDTADAANGVSTGDPAGPLDAALSVDDFKADIRDLLESAAP